MGNSSRGRARNRAIRARMAATGERWTRAAHHVDASAASTTGTREASMINAALSRVRLLDTLYDFQPAELGQMASVNDVIPPGELTEHTEHLWRDLLRSLERDDLLKLSEAMGFEGTSMVITQTGREDVEARRARRSDPALRSMAARDAVVRWLYAQPAHQAPAVHAIAEDENHFYEGQPLTVKDLDAAVDYLYEAGLVAGKPMMGGAIARPRLTKPEGIDCAEQYGGSVSDYQRRANGGPQTTVNFHAAVSGNVAWANQSVQQTATTNSGLAGDELQNMVRAIVEALPVLGLSEDQAGTVRSQLNTIEGELAGGSPDAGVVKTFMMRVVASLASATNSSLAAVLSASAKELMKSAGIPIE